MYYILFGSCLCRVYVVEGQKFVFRLDVRQIKVKDHMIHLAGAVIHLAVISCYEP